MEPEALCRDISRLVDIDLEERDVLVGRVLRHLLEDRADLLARGTPEVGEDALRRQLLSARRKEI